MRIIIIMWKTKSSFLQRLNPIRNATMGRWVRAGDRIFVKKRYGKTRVGGCLFSVRVELPFFYALGFLMEFEFFRPVIFHRSTARNFSYGFLKRCFITKTIKYF